MDTKLPSVNTSVLPVLRRYAKHAYFLHGYLIACLILLPTYRSPSYSQDAGSYEEPSVPTEPPPQADPLPAEPTPEPAPDPSTMDSDGDHLSDAAEASYGTNPYTPDSDYDGITDADEGGITGTNPLLPDSNGNNVSDYNEFYGNYTVTADYNSGVNTTDPSQTTTEHYFSTPSPVDYDQDGIEDHLDPDPYTSNNIPDQDGDYVPDNEDSDPSASWLWNDWNRNGTNDDAEYVAPDPSPTTTTTETYTPPENPDHDADGIANETDSHPWDSMLFNDWNFNGSNDQDEDWDGDGVANLQDSHPNSNILWCDWNQNNVNDDAEAALSDSDGDGHLDQADSHPYNSSLWSDWNGNGTNDSSETTTPSDNDNDGTPDGSDSHPYNSSLWSDWNGNGTNDSSETTTPPDNDSDGTPDGSDSHPYNSSLWSDWNGNGTNDNSETTVLADSDGDGTYDGSDTDPQNPQLWNDQNRNGQNDQNEVIITDNDADGYANNRDTHPDDSGRWNDHNNDGINDEQQAPQDSDGDGISDDQDSFPYDIDNDGITDLDELAMGTDPSSSDTDGDGTSDSDEAYVGTNPNNVDSDSDGLTDTEEVFAYQTDPNTATVLVATEEQADSINAAPDGQTLSTLPGGQPSLSVATLPAAVPAGTTTAPLGSPVQSQPVAAKTIEFKGRFTVFQNTAAALVDTDEDEIPDVVEDLYSPLMDRQNPEDASGDLDSDGISNLAEFQAGTDLKVSTTKVNAADLDSDGMTNIIEDKYSSVEVETYPNGVRNVRTLPGLNRLKPDGTEDWDRDGVNNYEEVTGKWHLTSRSPQVAKASHLFTLKASDPTQKAGKLAGNISFWAMHYQLGHPSASESQLRLAALGAQQWFNGSDAYSKRMANAFRTALNARTLAEATAFWDLFNKVLTLQERKTFVTIVQRAALTPTVEVTPDMDNDLLLDAWEAAYGFDYHDERDAGLPTTLTERHLTWAAPPKPGMAGYSAKEVALYRIDPDNDRVPNVIEYLNRTHPTVKDYKVPPDAPLQLTAASDALAYYSAVAPPGNGGGGGRSYPYQAHFIGGGTDIVLQRGTDSQFISVELGITENIPRIGNSPFSAFTTITSNNPNVLISGGDSNLAPFFPRDTEMLTEGKRYNFRLRASLNGPTLQTATIKLETRAWGGATASFDVLVVPPPQNTTLPPDFPLPPGYSTALKDNFVPEVAYPHLMYGEDLPEIIGEPGLTYFGVFPNANGIQFKRYEAPPEGPFDYMISPAIVNNWKGFLQTNSSRILLEPTFPNRMTGIVGTGVLGIGATYIASEQETLWYPPVAPFVKPDGTREDGVPVVHQDLGFTSPVLSLRAVYYSPTEDRKVTFMVVEGTIENPHQEQKYTIEKAVGTVTFHILKNQRTPNSIEVSGLDTTAYKITDSLVVGGATRVKALMLHPPNIGAIPSARFRSLLPIDLDIIHPASGELAEGKEDCGGQYPEDGKGGLVALRRNENTPMTKLVLRAVSSLPSDAKFRVKKEEFAASTTGSLKIWRDQARTQAVTDQTEFPTETETTLYLEGVERTFSWDLKIKQQIKFGSSWVDGDKVSTTVVHAEIPIVMRAFIPHRWTRGEHFPPLPPPLTIGYVVGGDRTDYTLRPYGDTVETAYGRTCRLEQTTILTPFKELHTPLDIESARKERSAIESDYYKKSTKVPASDQNLDFGETLVPGATADYTYPPSVTDKEYKDGRRYTDSGHPISELTITLSGEPGMPFGAAWGVAPNIDWKYVVKIDTRYPHSLTAKVEVEHNLYPAYEVIIGNSDETYVPLWQIKPAATTFPGAGSLNQNLTGASNEKPIK